MHMTERKIINALILKVACGNLITELSVESDNVVIVIVEHKRIVHGSLVRLVYLKTCYCDISIAV